MLAWPLPLLANGGFSRSDWRPILRTVSDCEVAAEIFGTQQYSRGTPERWIIYFSGEGRKKEFRLEQVSENSCREIKYESTGWLIRRSPTGATDRSGSSFENPAAERFLKGTSIFRGVAAKRIVH